MNAGKIELSTYECLDNSTIQEWNELASDNLFQHSKFLEVLRRAKVEDSKMHFVMVKCNDEAIASTVLTEYRLDLGLFMGSQSFISRVRKRWPSFLYIDVLFCGTPVSSGQSNFQVRVPIIDVLPEVLSYMQAFAHGHGIKHLIVKELNDAQRREWSSILKEKGYFHGYSLPETTIRVNWSAYADYLNSLKSSYRRQILKSLNLSAKRINDLPKIIENQVNILSSAEVNLDDFFEKYLSVMDRALVKMETLNKDFFKNLFRDFSDDLVVFTYVRPSGERSYFLCVKFRSTLYFLWTARTDSDSDNDYFILLQAIVKFGIENNFETIHMGQTSYYPKMRIGAFLEDRHVFHKCASPILHNLLKACRYLIYPKEKTHQIEPFKSAEE